MSAPKHLWSGDWRADSAAAAQELAGHRIETPPSEEPPAPPPRGPSLLERALAALRAARQAFGSALAELAAMLRRARIPTGTAIVVVAVLAIVGAAYGLSALSGSSGSSASGASGNAPYLGVQMESVPVNRVLIAGVTPGSPADRAGLGPGDVITSVNQHPVGQPGDVIGAINSLHPGNSVLIQFNRGGIPYSTQVTLTRQPASP